MSVSENNSRIAKNTLFLYVRLLLTLIVGLYTSRVVLATLGESDFGLYGVVGGVVAMFGFLNSTLSSSTQRYLNYELGTGDAEKLKKVFSTAFVLHLLLIVVVLLFAETIGLWFVKNKLNIPEGRETAAIWVYQFSILAACINIFQLPFMSAIIAHEKMKIYAYVSVFETVMKLLLVFLIQVLDYDKLVLYGALMLLTQLLCAAIYNIYSLVHYEEVSYRIHYDKPLFKSMLGFSWWNVIGSLAAVCNNYGLNIVFNLFFGTVVNAARTLAFQISSVIQQFYGNFQIAAKPQVVKYYANEEYKEMNQLVFNSAKYSAFLMLLLSIPIAIEIDFVLKVWLGNFPAYTPSFVRIVLFHSIVTSMMGPVIMVVHASGYLKAIAITAGFFNLLLLPLNYLLLKLGCSPSIALIGNVCGSFIETYIELSWMKHYVGFPRRDFYKKVYMVVFPLGFLMLLVPLLVHCIIPWSNDFLRFIVVGFTSLVTSCLVLWKWGIDENKRFQVLSFVKERLF